MLIFNEEQRFRQTWIWIIILGISTLLIILALWGTIQQIINNSPWGSNPMSNIGLAISSGLMIVFALLLILGFLKLRLITVVENQDLRIRFWPFPGKTILPADIQSARPITFSPLKDHGGWGIRYIKGGKAYTVSGKQGVELALTNGKKLVIGSQKSDELVRAIEQLRKTTH